MRFVACSETTAPGTDWLSDLRSARLLAWAEVAHCNSPSHTPGSCEATIAYLYPLAGGLLGEKIDGALHKSLFMSPQQKAVTIRPLIGGDRIGIAAAIRFNRGRQ